MKKSPKSELVASDRGKLRSVRKLKNKYLSVSPSGKSNFFDDTQAQSNENVDLEQVRHFMRDVRYKSPRRDQTDGKEFPIDLDPEPISELVEAAINEEPNKQWTEDHKNILHLVVEWNYPNAITYLFECSLGQKLINTVDKNRYTPLHLACQLDRAECVRALRRCPDADVYAEDEDGHSPVDWLFLDHRRKPFDYNTISCFVDILNSEQLLLPDYSDPKVLVFAKLLWHGSENTRKVLLSRMGRPTAKTNFYFKEGKSKLPDEFDYCRRVADALREGLEQDPDRYLDALSSFDLRDFQWDQSFKDHLVPMLLQTAVREARPNLVQGLLHQADRERLHIILTFRSYNSSHPVLHKTCLEWAVANNDRLTTTLILNEEYHYHKDDRIAGLHCIKNQLNPDELVLWTIETFTLFYPKTEFNKRIQPLFGASVVLIYLIGFMYDYYSDAVLANDYFHKGYVTNETDVVVISPNDQNDTQCFDEPLTPRQYQTAFISTVLAIGIPLFFPFIIVLKECPKNVTKILCCISEERRERIPEWGKSAITVFISVLLVPFSIILVASKHMYYKFWHSRARRKTRFRDKLQRYESIWGMIQMGEAGVEASGQLIIQIWLLSFMLKRLSELGLREVITMTFKGVFLFFFETTPLERSMGKLFISIVSIQLGLLTSYRMGKRGSVDRIHSVFFWLSLVCQITARVVAIGVHFAAVKNMPFQVPVFFLGILVHYLFVTLIKLRVEGVWQMVGDYRRTAAVISTLTSSLSYNRITPLNRPQTHATLFSSKSKRGSKNGTFKAHTLFFLLSLVENLLLVCSPYMFQAVPVPGKKYDLALRCFGEISINVCIGLMVVLALCSWAFQSLFYKVYGHPWVDINGPNWLARRESAFEKQVKVRERSQKALEEICLLDKSGVRNRLGRDIVSHA